MLTELAVEKRRGEKAKKCGAADDDDENEEDFCGVLPLSLLLNPGIADCPFR